MNFMFMKCGLIALGCFALSIGQVKADIILSASTKGVGGAFSITGGTVTGSAFSGTPGTDSSITMRYNVSGLDLSAEEAGATAASFDFDVTYTANSGAVFFSGGGNAGVGNTQVGGSEVLSLSVSNLTNIMGFGGTISFDGITSARLANFANNPDQQNLLLSDSSTISLVGAGDTTGSTPVGAAVGDTATISAALGITGFDQSAVAGSAGFRNLGTQFTATAAVPEPSSFALLGGALVCFAVRRRRRHLKVAA